MNIFDVYDDSTHCYQFSGESLVVHSEYFNVTFQKSLEGLGGGIDIGCVLKTSAQEVVYAQFSKYFEKNSNLRLEERKTLVEQYYAHCGFGILSMDSISNKGGHANLTTDHYALAWLRFFDKRSEDALGVGYFTLGFICGAVEAIYEMPLGTFDGKQSECISKGDTLSKFYVFRGLKKKLTPSPEMGKMQTRGRSTSVGSDLKVMALIRRVNLCGQRSGSGIIDAFDTRWTRHYSNYYALATIKLFTQTAEKLGKRGVKEVRKMLANIGETNAYFVLGKIMNSQLWTTYVLKKKETTWRSNLMFAMDVMTSLGYGKWDLLEDTDFSFTIDVENNPETNAFLELLGNTKSPVNSYISGFMVGVINYIKQNPKSYDVDDEFIQRLFSLKSGITHREKESRMAGGDKDTHTISINVF